MTIVGGVTGRLVLACLVTVGTCVLVLGVVGMGDSIASNVLIASIAALLIAPILWRIARRQFDPFEPVVLFAVAYGTMFVVRPLAMLIRGDLSYVRPTRTMGIEDTFTEMLLLALLGAIGFLAAYGLAGRHVTFLASRLPAPTLNVRRAASLAVLFGLLGLLLFAGFVIRAGGTEVVIDLLRGRDPAERSIIHHTTNYLYMGPYVLVPASVMLLALAQQERRRGLAVLGVIFATIVVIRAVPSGSRMLLLPLVGWLVTYYYLARMRRPGLVATLTLLVVALLSVTVLREIRSEDRRAVGGTIPIVKDIVTDPSRIYEPLLFRGDTEMAATLAVALQVIPEEFPRGLGSVLVGDLVTRPVPRVFWNDKPLSPREQIIQSLWPKEYEAGTANPEFSALLYFYWDLGVPGVIAGMAAYGFLARVLFVWWSRNQANLGTRVVYALALPLFVVALRDSPTDTLVRASAVILPALVTIYVARDVEATVHAKPTAVFTSGEGEAFAAHRPNRGDRISRTHDRLSVTR